MSFLMCDTIQNMNSTSMLTCTTIRLKKVQLSMGECQTGIKSNGLSETDHSYQ